VASKCELSLVCVRRFYRTQGRTFLKHEGQKSGQNCGYGPCWVPSVWMVVRTEMEDKVSQLICDSTRLKFFLSLSVTGSVNLSPA
jgi:hypothetical protein